jgi:hypothetical protein
MPVSKPRGNNDMITVSSLMYAVEQLQENIESRFRAEKYLVTYFRPKAKGWLLRPTVKPTLMPRFDWEAIAVVTEFEPKFFGTEN